MLLEHYPRDGTAIKKFCSEALIIFQASIKNIMSAAIYECLGTVPDRREKWVDHRGAGLGMSLALLGIPPRNEVQCCTERLYILLRTVDIIMFSSPLPALPVKGHNYRGANINARGVPQSRVRHIFNQ
jgi:hypothetical protein